MSEDVPRTPSRYAAGSTANVVRSLAVMVGLVALLWFLVPRPSDLGGPQVDIHATALEVAPRAGFPLVEAVGLPTGWKQRSARLVTGAAGLVTWHAGYETPRGTFVGVERTIGATDEWVTVQTDGAPRGPVVTAGGRSWVTMVASGGGQTSLLDLAADSRGVTTLVTGNASLEELEAFTAYLRPVTP